MERGKEQGNKLETKLSHSVEIQGFKFNPHVRSPDGNKGNLQTITEIFKDRTFKSTKIIREKTV